MTKVRFDDIRDLSFVNREYVNLVDSDIMDDSVPLVYDSSPETSLESVPTDFLDNDKENEYKKNNSETSEEFFPSQSLILQISFEIDSIANHGKLFVSEVMDVFLFIVNDQKLLASLIGISGLSIFLLSFLPTSYNISAFLFLCAPLSMAVMGFYKKERTKRNYGL